MSIASDIRSYADSAVAQGKQVLDQAQAQLNGVTDQANGLVGKITGTARGNVVGLGAKATDAYGEFVQQAEKAVNLPAIKAAVEPYLAQAREYTNGVTDRATGLLDTVKGDKRVARVLATTEALSDAVVETVNERVLKPVSTLRGGKPVTLPTTHAATRPAPKPAATKPAATKPAATKPATKATATKPAAKASATKSTAATPAPAKKAAAAKKPAAKKA